MSSRSNPSQRFSNRSRKMRPNGSRPEGTEKEEIADSLNCFRMELLIEIPRKKWIHLRDLYKTVWTEGVVAYCILDIHIANPSLSDNVNFKVYSPEGDIINGMVATIDMFGYYQLLIHPVKDIEKIYEALQNTVVINWDRDICVPSASVDVIECLRKLQKCRGINIKYETKAYKHFLDNDSPQYDVSVYPSDSYVGSLRPEYISLIDNTWTYHSQTTNKFFETLMKHDLTYVLYSRKDDKPMAWITVDVEGALTHLYTIEAYRRLGYGEFITKYAANDLRRKGRNVLAYTVEGNENPQQMFNKLGFREVGMDQWIFLHKT